MKQNINKIKTNKIKFHEKNKMYEKHNKQSTDKIKIDNKKKTSHIKLVLLLVGVFILGFLITTVIFLNTEIKYKESNLIDYYQINTSVLVVNPGVGGFNTDTSSLVYGKTGLGGGGIRYFDVFSPQKTRVEIIVPGQMGPFFVFKPNNFILEANETKRVAADLTIPSTARLGNYSDVIKIYFYKP